MPAPDSTTTLDNAVYEPRAALYFAHDPPGVDKAFRAAGVRSIAVGMTTVYEAIDAAGAESVANTLAIVTTKVEQFDKRSTCPPTATSSRRTREQRDDAHAQTVSKDTISRITDKVIEEMAEWCNRPLDSVYPVVFIDAIFVRSAMVRSPAGRSTSRSG
jgi:hypothetical protein